jgi:cation-transporting P-type ATPase 13A2
MTAALLAVYLLMDPSDTVIRVMQLTYLSMAFKCFLAIVAAGGFLISYLAERNLFPWLSKVIGTLHDTIWPQRRKKRKEYKLLLEEMRM